MAVIGVDIGGTKALAVRIEDGKVAATERHTLNGSEDLLEAVEKAVASVSDGEPTAVGVGIAGLVDQADRTFVWGPHVAGDRVAVGAELETRFGVPVAVDNDANTALIAELELGVASGYRDVLLVTLGTGIGGAIAVDGEIYRGGGYAGEWGHMRVVADGLLCDCGKRGCWETLASGPALERLAREVLHANPSSSLARSLGDQEVTGYAVVASADHGDETARALVAEVGRAFGQGLADLAAIFDPELIVVGGGLGSVGEGIVGPARRVLADAIHGAAHRIAPTVQVARLGPTAGAVGAALLAAEATNGS